MSIDRSPSAHPSAIPTRYAGCHFRSRLEARWAVFFDTLGIRWEYEPEGYDLASGRYLPDFLLPNIDVWFEVKPALPDNEDERWYDLAKATLREVIVARGMPRPDEDVVWGGTSHDGWMISIDPFEYEGEVVTGWDNGRAFVICPDCHKLDITYEGRTRLHCHPSDDEYRSSPFDRRIIHAYTAAHSSRFEHGQSGAT